VLHRRGSSQTSPAAARLGNKKAIGSKPAIRTSADSFQPFPTATDITGAAARARKYEWLPICRSRNKGFSGAKFLLPNCRLSNLIAVSKFPAAACSPAREDFLVQIWLTGMPAVGVTNTGERALPADFGVSISGGSSRAGELY
jgi:hypothetical protein